MSQHYPDPNEVDENPFDHLHELPDGTTPDTSWVKNNIWSEAESFQIPRSIIIRGMQANMYTIEMKFSNEDILRNEPDNSSANTRRVIAKRVVPSELPPKED